MTLTSEIADYFNMNMTDDPYWTESSWFSWAIPERGINGFFYNHFRPNMNCLLGGPAMWDNSGQHVWKFRYFDWQLMRVLPEGRYGIDYNKYDFVTPWSMSLKMLEPLQRYQLGYDRNGFRLDLEFTATAEANVIGAKPGMEKSFKLHFEQPGRIQGTVELDGEQFEVDCYSIRDGSHGPRFLENAKPGGYTWSTADANNGWHLIARDNFNSRETQVFGGYLLRDGTMAPLTEGIRRVMERAGPRPDVIEIEAVDSLGRTLEATGRAKTPAEFMLFPDRGQWWTQFAWQYDHFTAAVGEDQEYYNIQDFRRWHRGGETLWQTR